jgi:DNA gyrase subunit A
MMIEGGQSVICMLVSKNDELSVLTATENGYGKRTRVTEYPKHGRGTKGVMAIASNQYRRWVTSPPQ